MELYYFGDSKSPLLGCHLEPPHGTTARQHGVVVCSPIAQEYVRTHWALRQLGATLARAGYHVMRFDYSCHGDSAGESVDADVERWRGDVRTAVEELRDVAGVRKVSLVGLRFGAVLAARAADAGLKIDTLILWDPVVSGRAYLAELARVHQAMMNDPKRYGFSLRRDLDQRLGKWVPWLRLVPRPEPDGELVGFAFPPAMRRAIEAIDLTSGPPPAVRRFVLVRSEPRPEYDDLRAALERSGTSVLVRDVGARGRWADFLEVENALLPGDAPRVIEAALSAREAAS